MIDTLTVVLSLVYAIGKQDAQMLLISSALWVCTRVRACPPLCQIVIENVDLPGTVKLNKETLPLYMIILIYDELLIPHGDSSRPLILSNN